MVSDEQRLIAQNYRENVATAGSIITSVVVVVFAFLFGWPLFRTGLILVAGGLLAYGSVNIMGRVVIRPVLQRKKWALAILIVAMPVVVFSVSAYMAGAILLICSGVAAVWSFLFG